MCFYESLEKIVVLVNFLNFWTTVPGVGGGCPKSGVESNLDSNVTIYKYLYIISLTIYSINSGPFR